MSDLQSTATILDVGLGPPSRATRVLLWCAGADHDLLFSREHRYRYSGYGLILLLVGFLAAVSLVLFASVVAPGGFHPTFLLAGLLWGTFIFFIDRMIVADPKRRSVGRGAKVRKTLLYLLRVAVSVGAAIIVCEAILLMIFSAEINRALPIIQRLEIETEAKRIWQDEVTRQENAIGELEPDVEAARTERDDAFTALQTERETLPDTAANTPDGDRVDAFDRDYQDKNAEFKRLDGALQTAKTNLDQYRQGALPPVPTDIQDRIRADRGWTAREAALDRVLDEHPAVRPWPWIIRIVLIAFDLMPLLSKLLTPRSQYDEAIERQEAWITTRELHRDTVNRYRADLEVENRNAWVRVDRNLERDRMGLWMHNGSPAGRHGAHSDITRQNGRHGSVDPAANGSSAHSSSRPGTGAGESRRRNGQDR